MSMDGTLIRETGKDVYFVFSEFFMSAMITDMLCGALNNNY